MEFLGKKVAWKRKNQAFKPTPTRVRSIYESFLDAFYVKIAALPKLIGFRGPTVTKSGTKSLQYKLIFVLHLGE